MKQDIKKEFAKYTTLNIMGMLGLSCYILADTFFVSHRMGADGLAALNIAISIYSFINGAGLMIGIGGATRYAICKSRGEERKADRIFTESVMLGIAAGLIFAIIGIIGASSLAGVLGAKGIIQTMSSSYLRILMCFAPFFILNNILIAFIRNDGAPKLSMGAMLVGSLSNIILDYLFMYPLGMGMAGAALATGAAPVIGLSISSFHFIKRNNHFHFAKVQVQVKEIGEICGLGISAFINEVSSGVVLVVFNLLMLKFAGNTGVAAYGIVANLALVALAVFTGIAQGSQPLISRYYGKGQKENLKKVYRYAAIMAGCIGLVIFVAVFAFSSPLTSIFNSGGDHKLQELAEKGLQLYFIGFLIAGVNIITAAYLAAIERAKQSFLISIFRGGIGIVTLVLVMSQMWEVSGIWLSFPVCEIITVGLCIFFIKQKTVKD